MSDKNTECVCASECFVLRLTRLQRLLLRSFPLWCWPKQKKFLRPSSDCVQLVRTPKGHDVRWIERKLWNLCVAEYVDENTLVRFLEFVYFSFSGDLSSSSSRIRWFWQIMHELHQPFALVLVSRHVFTWHIHRNITPKTTWNATVGVRINE